MDKKEIIKAIIGLPALVFTSWFTVSLFVYGISIIVLGYDSRILLLIHDDFSLMVLFSLTLLVSVVTVSLLDIIDEEKVI